MISPTRQSPRLLAPGGNLARAHSTRAGLSRYPSRTSLGALCSVLLTRDARSLRGRGRLCVGANRAVCMSKRRGGFPQQAPRRRCSLGFIQPANNLGTDNTDRHQPSRLGGGAAGPVMRNTPPRQSILGQVNNIHTKSSVGFVSCNIKPKRGLLRCLQRGFAKWQVMR